MFDPAVMGTLLIGLGSDRVKTREDRRHVAVASPPRRSRLRRGLADVLHRTAMLLDRPAVGDVANPG